MHHSSISSYPRTEQCRRRKIPRFCISKSPKIKIFEDKLFEMGTEEGRGTEKEEEHEMKQKHDN